MLKALPKPEQYLLYPLWIPDIVCHVLPFMTIFLIIVLTISAFAIGLLSAALGIGGGAFTVPLLVSIGQQIGLPESTVAQTAVSVSLLTAVVLSFSATTVNLRKKKVKFLPAGLLVTGSVPGSYTGAVIAQYLSKQQILLIFGFLISIIAVRQIFRRVKSAKIKAQNNKTDSTDIQKTDQPVKPGLIVSIVIIILGFLVGNVSSLTGIGGGILMVPVLSIVIGPGRFEEAIATSSFCIIITAVTGIFVFATSHVPEMPSPSVGYLYIPFIVPMMIGAFIGGFSGAKLKGKIPEARLKLLFAVSLVLVIIKVVYDALFSS